jgi:hypothetical protein
MLGMKSWALCMLDKHSSTELLPIVVFFGLLQVPYFSNIIELVSKVRQASDMTFG